MFGIQSNENGVGRRIVFLPMGGNASTNRRPVQEECSLTQGQRPGDLESSLCAKMLALPKCRSYRDGGRWAMDISHGADIWFSVP
jgi:hypothetical protein